MTRSECRDDRAAEQYAQNGTCAFNVRIDHKTVAGVTTSLGCGAMSDHAIALRDATKQFPHRAGGTFTAIRDVTMEVARGEFVTVVGPTGCGKSTTLSLVSGLEPATHGTVTVNGLPVRGIPEGVGYMFQSDAVLPWKTVLDNVALGLRYHRVPKAEAHARARDYRIDLGRQLPERWGGRFRKAAVFLLKPDHHRFGHGDADI